MLVCFTNWQNMTRIAVPIDQCNGISEFPRIWPQASSLSFCCMYTFRGVEVEVGFFCWSVWIISIFDVSYPKIRFIWQNQIIVSSQEFWRKTANLFIFILSSHRGILPKHWLFVLRPRCLAQPFPVEAGETAFPGQKRLQRSRSCLHRMALRDFFATKKTWEILVTVIL